MSDTNKTIVDSTCDTHASGWLTAIPTTPELSASNDTMTTVLKTFLGIPLVAEKVTCKFCNASIDDFLISTPSSAATKVLSCNVITLLKSVLATFA